MTRTSRGEIHIASMFWVLGRENVIEHRRLIEIAIHTLMVDTVQILGQLQHIIGITSLWSVDIVDIVYASFLSWEMLTTAVSTQSERTLASHYFPEILTGIMILHIMC